MLAQTTNAPPELGRFVYEWSWLESLQQQPAAMAAASVALGVVIALTFVLHRRERHSISGWLSAWLLLLRVVAIAGVVLFLLGPQRRRAETVTRPSRVAVIVDTSASMAMPSDLDVSGSRSLAAKGLLFDQELLAKLSETHAVSVVTTSGGTIKPVVKDDKAAPEGDAAAPPWPEPTGGETRLGDAMRDVLESMSGEPLAGVVLLTDGQNNAGEPPAAVASAASGRGARVMTIGFGPARAGANVIVRELVAPSRAYPEDEIELTALVEVTGDPGGSPSFSLYRRMAEASEGSQVLLETQAAPDSTKGEANGGGQTYSIRFKTRPEAAGRYLYIVDASPLTGEVRKDDNRREAMVEVVDQTTTVLLWASGPNRDFRFLRNQLKRDDSFVVDVLLQSAASSASQDARAVLTSFPETDEQLNEYDVLVAFDPDWSQVSDEQTEWIEAWISKRGAGFYFAPGPVNTPKWFQRGPSDRIKSLLPVALPDRLTLLEPVGGAPPPERPWPVQLTRAGAAAEFLWVAGGREASGDAWREFPGFYGVGETASLRPGATVYSNVAGPDQGDERAVFVEQYYGAGRVFYSGVSELWRLRAEDPEYFNAIWTKLLRRLAQGRLLANTSGGRLLFERDRYQVGDTITLRALLPSRTDAGPVRVQLAPPTGEPFSLSLEASETQDDAWGGEFPAVHEGRYEALTPGTDGSPLIAQAEVFAPVAERDKPTRDESALRKIAEAGGGWYYPTVGSVLKGADPAPPLVDAIPSREETRIVFGKPDLAFAELLSQVLLGVIVGALVLEWFSRRLASLA